MSSFELNYIAGKQCPICGSLGEEYGVKSGYNLRICNCVGSGLLSWQFQNIKEYEQIYTTTYHFDYQKKNNYKPYIERDDEFVEAAEKRTIMLNAIVGDIQNKTLLDIGAGTGAFVGVAQKYGYQSLGIEPCNELVEYGLNNKRNMITGKCKNIKGKWDIVVLHDVFEHFVHPIASLYNIKQHLNSGGLLVIEIPEFGCYLSQLRGMEWKHIKPLEHLWMPDITMMQFLLKEMGFLIVGVFRPLRGSLGKVVFYIINDGDI
jgi:2-polyprenyl-3-methyl-5-hydroxy-6-metoxy-1,4-benzoquinol methylase